MQLLKEYTFIVLLTSCIMMLAGCDDDQPNPAGPDIVNNDTSSRVLFMAQSDFQSGYFERLSMGTQAVLSSGFSIYSDASVRSYNGFVYIIEHMGADNIIKYNPSKGDASGIVYQMHIGNNWNPQDIEFISDTKAYIVNMNEPKITIFNPSTQSILANIDISPYTYMKDSNTSPYANNLQLVGTDLYAMLQRRNGYKPGAQTLLLKINTLTDQITDTIQLKNMNGSEMTYYDGALYITNPGSLYKIGDGAVEKVNLADKTVTEIISETALGGNPYMITHKTGSIFYLTNYIQFKNVPVIELDVKTGTIVGKLQSVKDAFGGFFYDEADSVLYVGERDSLEMGVRVFKNDIQTAFLRKSANSLPVSSLCVVR